MSVPPKQTQGLRLVQSGVTDTDAQPSRPLAAKSLERSAMWSEFDKPLPQPVSVKARAVRLLAQREYSRQALQEKLLAEAASSAEEVAQTLADLETRGLLDDHRVAETLVNRRAGKWGGLRLRQALQAKGVSAEVVAQAVAQLKDSELARAQSIWQKKYGRIATDANTRHRQARFLATRGFSSDVVRRVVAGLEDDR